MKLVVSQAKHLSTKLEALPSKFHTQLACVAGMLGKRKSLIKSPSRVRDTQILLKIGEIFDVIVSKSGGSWLFSPPESLRLKTRSIDAKNSGTVLSLVIPLVIAGNAAAIVTGDPFLRKRKVGGLLSLLHKLGVEVHSIAPAETPPLMVFNTAPRGGRVACQPHECYHLPAALLLSPFANEDVEIRLPNQQCMIRAEPVLEIMRASGIRIAVQRKNILVSPSRYRGLEYSVPKEISAAAPFVIGSLLVEKQVEVQCKDETPRDREFLELLKNMGVVVHRRRHAVFLNAERLRGRALNLSSMPELAPFFAVLGVFARGKTRIVEAQEARNMKTDRIAAIVRALKIMGAKIVETPDGLVVKGTHRLKGKEVDGANDYAVTAALTAAALRSEGDTRITNGIESLKRGYPQFIRTFRNLGAEIGTAIK